ncbi:DUF3199 family protein [Sediminibacillus terrae]|uniref:DUF3199 family protein n=1 Tax=Sediminibacillus terrae TaxID=1562106 RepID=UPI0012964409|nr:DUF3199 family protein [Sediminibacillus terrae]
MFATAEEVKERASFEEVSSLSNEKLENYILRAERWIFRATGVDYSNEEDIGILEDLKVATSHLVDYLWLWDQPDIKEALTSPYDSESIGSYSFQLKNLTTMKNAVPGEKTGIKELDNILEDLKPAFTAPNFFRVSGPSR